MKHNDIADLFTTRPLIPPLDEFVPYLEQIWQSKTLTNNGPFHCELEEKLCKYLGVEYISIFSNGTLALIVALQALKIKGEVITTPYSFVATTHALWWNGIKPVFVDIDPKTGNLDPEKIESAITPQTTAILPTHVYGNPCNTKRIEEIAQKHNLKVIYDAAHAFGIRKEGKTILNEGDLSILSFHATKVFSTIEGGAVVCHSPEMKHHLDNLKNFGFRGETIVEEPGINAKLNEVQAAYGLLSLKYINAAISQRRAISSEYRKQLQHIEGIELFEEDPLVEYNYAYFPIFVNEEQYGMSRDELYNHLRNNTIYARRYFYPLISDFEPYRNMPSASAAVLPKAHQIANKVICLPMYHEMNNIDIDRVTYTIRNNKS